MSVLTRQHLDRVFDDYRWSAPDGAHTTPPEVTLIAPDILRQVLRHKADVLPRPLVQGLCAALHAATVSHRNPALVHYYTDAGGHWLMASVRPYILGEGCDGTRDREMYFLLGQFLHYAMRHHARWPSMPQDHKDVADLWLEAYRWRLKEMDARKAADEANSLRRRGRACLGGHALDGIGAEPADLVQFDPDWPPEQVQQLLHDAYDMNHRSLVTVLERWIEQPGPPTTSRQPSSGQK